MVAEEPDGEGVELILIWPAVDGVFIEAFIDEGVDKVREASCVQLAAILSVVFEQHEEAGSEGGENIAACVDHHQLYIERIYEYMSI